MPLLHEFFVMVTLTPNHIFLTSKLREVDGIITDVGHTVDTLNGFLAWGIPVLEECMGECVLIENYQSMLLR